MCNDIHYVIHLFHYQEKAMASAHSAEPHHVPLDKQLIPYDRNCVKEQIPALHKLWVDVHDWVPYRAPPFSEYELEIPGARETWCERAQLVLDDLDYILRLPHHKVTC